MILGTDPTFTGPLGTPPTTTGPLGTEPTFQGPLGTVAAITDAELLKIAQDYEASRIVVTDIAPLVERFALEVREFPEVSKVFESISGLGAWRPTKEHACTVIAWRTAKRDGKI